MKHMTNILHSWKTVFSYSDMQLITWISNYNTLRSFVARQIKTGMLQKIHKWLYALQEYDIYELATKAKKNSYISFETVLKDNAIIFQDYGNSIFLASDNTWTKETHWLRIQYNKIKDDILYNPLWVTTQWNYTIASSERAICDRVYISGAYYFDNLTSINTDKLKLIANIYNKRVVLYINTLIKDAQHQTT
jgi:hypothetical protein